MCWLETDNRRRRQEWERLFGDDRVPVVHDRPVLAYGRRGDPVYVLDVDRLHPFAQQRVALHVAGKTGRSLEQVLDELREGTEVVTFDPKQTRLVTD